MQNIPNSHFTLICANYITFCCFNDNTPLPTETYNCQVHASDGGSAQVGEGKNLPLGSTQPLRTENTDFTKFTHQHVARSQVLALRAVGSIGKVPDASSQAPTVTVQLWRCQWLEESAWKQACLCFMATAYLHMQLARLEKCVFWQLVVT